MRGSATTALRLGLALASAASVLLLPSCTSSPAQPTQAVVALKLACPTAMSLVSPSGQPEAVSYGGGAATGGTQPATVTCSPASGATFPIGLTTVTCIARDQFGRTDACTFTVTVASPPRLAATRFLAFGDSMTWGEDGQNSATRSGETRQTHRRVQLPLAQTYPGVLQATLAARYTAQSPTVTNAGNPGEAVMDATTFPRFVGLTSSGAYDAVLLMEGANDLAADDDPDVVAGLGRMIDDARSRGLRVFLATLPPENPAGFDPTDRGIEYQAVAPLNALIAGLAASKGIPLVDVNRAFNGNLALIGPDGLHPTAEGYKLIADTFFTAIKATLEVPAPAVTSTRPVPLLIPTARR